MSISQVEATVYISRWSLCIFQMLLCVFHVFISRESASQQTRDFDRMLGQCWAGAGDGGPALSQRWVNVLCLVGCINWRWGGGSNMHVLPRNIFLNITISWKHDDAPLKRSSTLGSWDLLHLCIVSGWLVIIYCINYHYLHGMPYSGGLTSLFRGFRHERWPWIQHLSGCCSDCAFDLRHCDKRLSHNLVHVIKGFPRGFPTLLMSGTPSKRDTFSQWWFNVRTVSQTLAWH